MAKTHTLIVRGLPKEEKDSLKRLSKTHLGKLSMNQYLLYVISAHTAKERAEFKKLKVSLREKFNKEIV